jgi:hypothetical protein
MIGILPQGGTHSEFGRLDPGGYVTAVFTRLAGELPSLMAPQRIAGTLVLVPGRIVISGHSGGGPSATRAAVAMQAGTQADVDAWLTSSPLLLFDAINGPGELETVGGMVEQWLARDLAIIRGNPTTAADLLRRRGVKLVSTYTAGGVYARMNGALRTRIRTWITTHSRVLGAHAAVLREQYRVETVAGSHDYTVGAGRAAPSSARGIGGVPSYSGGGHLEGALSHLPPVQRQVADAAPVVQRQPQGGPTAAPPGPAADVVTLDGQCRDDIFQGVRTAIITLRQATDGVTTAPAGAARRAARVQRTRAEQALRSAVLRLAAQLRSNLPPRNLLDRFLSRPNVSTDDKARVVGLLAVEVARMEFLLGRMHHLGATHGWESRENRGPFPETYETAMHGGAAAWCTMFAGYAYSRLGFNAGGGGRPETSMFLSGYRLRHWARTGQTIAGTQVTDPSVAVAQGRAGAAMIDSPDWLAHTTALRRARTTADRTRIADEFLASHPAPRAGDILVKTRGNAQDNAFAAGSSSHTMMVENCAGHIISTVEGNHEDAIGGRTFDLANPRDTGQLIVLIRAGAGFVGPGAGTADAVAAGGRATAPPAPHGPGDMLTNLFASETVLLLVMRTANQQLAELDIAQGYVSGSNPNASVAELSGEASHAGRPVRED